MDDEKETLQDHHKRTGCRGEMKVYKENDEVKGYFCSSCKKEWLSNSLNESPPPQTNVKPVEHHIFYKFCCLQVSDTGNFVQWKNVKKTNGVLKPGDHVAWLRCFSYWHHAIVEKVEGDKITVIEWTSSGIDRTDRHKYDLIGNCCYSPMYKVFYPEDVRKQNPPGLVLLRARSRLNEMGYSLFSDNCEHFAAFCKTGSHQCNQLLQLKFTLRAWIRRFVATFIHIAAIVFFSESIEKLTDQTKEWLGATVMFITELMYLIIVLSVTYLVDTRRQGFVKTDPPSCTRACRCASIKAVFRSALVVVFSVVFSVYVTDSLGRRREGRFSDRQRTALEIGFGVLGGIIGNVIGFFIFAFIPYPCCRNEVTE